MQSNWLDATLRIDPDEMRLFNWVNDPILRYEEVPLPDGDDDLTNDEEYDIMLIENEIEEA